MYLYNKISNDNIEIYSMLPKEREIKAYRLVNMHDQPYSEFIVRHMVSEYDDKYQLNKFGHEVKPNIESGVRKLINATNNKFAPELIMNFKEAFEIMEEYYNNFDPSKYQIRHIIKKDDDYALIGKSFKYGSILFQSFRHWDDKELAYITNNLIKIPKNLYIIEMLLKEDFSVIQSYDIKEQLKLFEYCKLLCSSVKNINELEKCGLLNTSINSINNKITNDKIIIDKAKQLKII